MVGKLIKHQMREEAPMLGIALGGLLLMCGGLFITQSLIGSTAYIILSALLLLLAVGIALLSMCYIGFRFYKSMYGSEGYLTQTLPIGEKTVMRVKFLVAYCEQLIMYAALIPVVLLLFNATGLTVDIIASDAPFLLNSTYIAWMAVAFLVQTASQIAMIFLAITFANSKYVRGGSPFISIAAYAVLYFAMQIISLLAMVVIPICVTINPESITLSTNFMITNIIADPLTPSIGVGSFLIYPLFSIFGYVASKNLNKKHVIIR